MILITLTGITGTAPYVISICDVTKTYCYGVYTGTPTLPLTIQVPSQLSTANQVLLDVVDSQNCNYFQIISCIPPSATPTQTPTPTPTATPSNCTCLTFQNPTLTNLNITYKNCNGITISETCYAGTSLFYCGSNPTADTGVIVTIGGVCVNNTCPDPSPSSTPTPTNTPTQTGTSGVTPTPTPTQTPTPTSIPFFANWYNMVESPNWVYNNLFNGCYTPIPITFTMSSLVVNGTEYLTSPTANTFDNLTIITQPSTSNVQYTDCPPTTVITGLTYSNFVDFINNVIQSYGITGITAQLSNKTIIPPQINPIPPYDGPNSFAGFYIVYGNGITFSIDIVSNIGTPYYLSYRQDGLYFDNGMGYQLIPHNSYYDYILNVTPIVGGIVVE